MRKFIHCYCLLAATVLTNSLPAFSQATDPDVPGFIKGIDKAEYLMQRQNYFEQRNGKPGDLPYNPRLKAIAEMKQKEETQRNNRLSRMASPPWVQLGPSPIPNGQTTTTSVPVSGRVTAIAIHPTNSSIVYIGTANGGVYRTMNGGTNWTAIFDNAQSLAIGALALAPSSPSTLYVGTGEPQSSADSYVGVGLYRIDNADADATLVGPIDPPITYTNTSSGTNTTGVFTMRAISKILVHPTDAAIIFVSTVSAIIGNPNQSAGGGTVPPLALRGVYRSTNATGTAASVVFSKLTVDQGNCFDVPCTGNNNIFDIVLEPGNPNNLLCWSANTINAGSTIAGGGIYRSTNALAATPVFTKTYSSTSSSVRGELAIAKVDGNVIVYAGTAENGGNGRLLRSLDGGVTWATAPGTTTFCNGQCFYDIAIEVNPKNAAKVYVGGSSGTNIFRLSLDSLKTVPVSKTTALHADTHTIAVSPSDTSVVYFGCDGGIYKSIDGANTWISLNNAGLHATQFQSIALHPTDPKFTIGGTQDNGTNMMTSAGTFNRIDFGDGGYTAIDQNATDAVNVTMYHTYFNSTTLAGYARVDNVANASDGLWPFFGCNGTTGNGIACGSSVLFYAPLALGPGNPNTVYYGNVFLYRSADKGVLNTAVSQNLGSAMSSISISPQDDNYRIAGLVNGNVFATISGSSPLINITPPVTVTRAVGRVFIHPTNKNIAYVCYVGYGVPAGQHIWKTTNLNDLGGAGVTWTAAGNGLPDVSVNSFTISSVNPNLVFCGTDIGVFATNDAGANWVPYNTGLPVVPVFDMAIHKVSNVLRIATHGRGFWEASAFPLPVTFTEFTAAVKSKTTVMLEWFTASETNNKGFEVQRAAIKGGQIQAWENIGFVKGSGTTNSPRRYQLDDMPVGGRKFVYRLRQIDYDNNSKFSDQRQVGLGEFDFAIFPIYPNPVKGLATIKYQLPDEGKASMAIYNSAGALVQTILNEQKEAGIYQATINTDKLAAGAYYIRLSIGNYYNTKSFVVQ